MACRFNNGRCCGCDKFVKTTKISEDGVNLTLTIPERVLRNGDELCVCLAQPIPEFLDILSVNISVGSEIFPILCTSTQFLSGVPNFLYTSQLLKHCDGTPRSRQILSIRFASDTKVFNYVGCRRPMCGSGIQFPVMEAVPAKTLNVNTK